MKAQASGTFYQSLFDNMLDGVAYCQLLFDAKGNPTDFKFTQVNKNFEKSTGLRNATGKKATELLPNIRTANKSLFNTYSRLASAGATATPERFETYIELLSKWFLVTAYSPRKKFFVSTFQNITDRKRVEQDLNNANIAARNVLEDLSIEKTKVELAKVKDEAILESTGEGLIALDNDRKIIMINKVATDMLGVSTRRLMGKEVTFLNIEDEAGRTIAYEERPAVIALTTGKIIKTSCVLVRQDGSRLPMAITATPIKLNGETIGLIEVIRDITKEKEIDKVKTEFASLVSHQLRTPFSTINWYVEVLLTQNVGKLNTKQKRYLEAIYLASNRMVDLVNVLLSISRIEMGKTLLDTKPVNVVMLAEVIVKERRMEMLEKSLKIHTLYEKNVPRLVADPKQISMIFQNLLSNAIKYTPPGGTVHFDISVERTELVVSVRDTGIGIPQSAKSKMFTRFFRADNARQSEPEGAGLGLYLVKAIVDQMEGKIWYDSKEDVGTTFYVSFPLKVPIKKPNKASGT